MSSSVLFMGKMPLNEHDTLLYLVTLGLTKSLAWILWQRIKNTIPRSILGFHVKANWCTMTDDANKITFHSDFTKCRGECGVRRAAFAAKTVHYSSTRAITNIVQAGSFLGTVLLSLKDASVIFPSSSAFMGVERDGAVLALSTIDARWENVRGWAQSSIFQTGE